MKRYVLIVSAEKAFSRQSKILVLTASILLCVLLAGCGKFLHTALSKGKYQTPTAPRTELASIQIDSASGWLQRINQLAVRVDGRLALEKKLDPETKQPFNEILVSPGKHDLSVGIIHKSYEEVTPSMNQVWTTFSGDVKAGREYVLEGEFSPGVDGELSFDSWLVEASAGERLSK